jgi:ankyrin repeat protein
MNHDSGAEQAKVVSNDGFNALLVAVEDGRTDVVEVLVRHKSCIDQVKVVNKAGLNALELAMKNGNQAIVDLLTPFM